MWRIPDNRLGGWTTQAQGSKKYAFPTTADVVCPHCHVLRGFTYRADIRTVETSAALKALCPGCRQGVRFWIVDANDEGGQGWSGAVWMDPDSPQRARLPVEGVLSDRLASDYQAAINSFEHGVWRAAAQMARTVMEGVIITLLGEPRGRRTLGPLLRDLEENADLAAPLRDIGRVLKDGGNVASHFDEAREITEEVASETLDLLEAFIEYLVLLPERTHRLTELLEEATAKD